LASEDSALAAQVPDQPDRSFIAQFYDVDRSGNRTLGAKFWLASEHAKNKSVISVPGVGNCFWETLVAAGIPLGTSESDGRALAYGDYKRATEKYYRSEDFQKLLQHRDSHGIVFEALSGLDTEDGCKEVESRLTTDGASACETCFQLAALSLNVDISIEDISRPGYMLGFYSGTPNQQKAQNQILLLLRNHATHAVYNSRFELMKDNYSKEVRSSGHFWLAVEQPQTSDSREASVSQGNEWRSALARP
jgi:hypothetical protein